MFFNDEIPKDDKSSEVGPKYDYCESNINSFNESMQKLEGSAILYTEENFDIFVKDIKQKIDEHFLIDVNTSKKSKRTFFFNPWITPGIISSIKKKHFYYKQWKKTVSKKDKVGSFELY